MSRAFPILLFNDLSRHLTCKEKRSDQRGWYKNIKNFVKVRWETFEAFGTTTLIFTTSLSILFVIFVISSLYFLNSTWGKSERWHGKRLSGLFILVIIVEFNEVFKSRLEQTVVLFFFVNKTRAPEQHYVVY